MPRRYRTRRSRNPRTPRSLESQAIDDDTSCWRGFTALEIRLLRIIIVEISFLLICIAIHVAFSSCWSTSGECTDLCQTDDDKEAPMDFPNGKQDEIFADVPDDLGYFVDFEPSFLNEKLNTCNTTRKKRSTTSKTSTTRKPRGSTAENEIIPETTTETTTTTLETTTTAPLITVSPRYDLPAHIAIMRAMYEPDRPYYVYSIVCSGGLISHWYGLFNNDGCLQPPLYDEYEDGSILRYTIRTGGWSRVTSDNENYYKNPLRVFIAKLYTFKELAVIQFDKVTHFYDIIRIYRNPVTPKVGRAISCVWPLKQNISFLDMQDTQPVVLEIDLTGETKLPRFSSVVFVRRAHLDFYLVGLVRRGDLLLNVTQGEYYDWLDTSGFL